MVQVSVGNFCGCFPHYSTEKNMFVLHIEWEKRPKFFLGVVEFVLTTLEP